MYNELVKLRNWTKNHVFLNLEEILLGLEQTSQSYRWILQRRVPYLL